MIDLKLLRTQREEYKNKILKKDPSFPFDELLAFDEEKIKKKIELDDLLNQNNVISSMGKSGIISEENKEKARTLNNKIESVKKEYNEIEKKFNYLYLRCPNIPDDSIPIGNKESNEIIKKFGEMPVYNFIPKNHVDLLINEKMVDFKIGAKIASSGFIFYHEKAAWLIYRLCMIFLKHNKKYGFNVVIPPFLISEEALTAASNLPRFEDDVFKCEKDNLYLLPTAEVALNYIHSGEIISEEELPLRYTAWTGCFRREAGGYGANEKGLIRIHQFEKVEIFSFTAPEKSFEEQEYILACAEDILQKFNLHYRIALLAGQDCSFASIKTYDIEVWLPGQNQYREISSISNCGDFQSRRSKTRFKGLDQKASLVHTLNGSCFAIPRLLVALFETFQDKDGNILFEEIDALVSNIEKSV